MHSKKHTPLPKPSWLRVKAPTSAGYKATYDLVKKYNLNTVCQEAACPNIGECWQQQHATAMIMGEICTRSCRFCNVKTGKPTELDDNEPHNLANMAQHMDLKHMVITSVDRDDLSDGGAVHFANCIKEIKKVRAGKTTIEVLTPDFRGKEGALEKVVEAMPDVYNHNIETVPALYNYIRPGARYFHSLNLLFKAKKLAPMLFTKSGLMLGLGETEEQVLQVMDDLRAAEVDFITIGQYLQPTPNHANVERYVTPEEFDYYRKVAESKGFLMVSSSPLTRSSYHAGDDFKKMVRARYEKINKQS